MWHCGCRCLQPPAVIERRAHDHFHALRASVSNERLAYRKRKRVRGVELAVALQALIASAVGWGNRTAGPHPDTSAILIAGGLTCALMAKASLELLPWRHALRAPEHDKAASPGLAWPGLASTTMGPLGVCVQRVRGPAEHPLPLL